MSLTEFTAKYPEQMPVAEFQEASQIILAGEFAAKRKELGLDLYAVQGFAQKMLIGEPVRGESGETEGGSGGIGIFSAPVLTPEQEGIVHVTAAQMNGLYAKLYTESVQQASGGFGGAPAAFEVMAAGGRINWQKLFDLAAKLLPLLLAK
jgi:hypothetical protein